MFQELKSFLDIISSLKKKWMTKDYIYFKTNLPSLSLGVSDIVIEPGASDVNIRNTDFFLTYGILHELIQIYNTMTDGLFEFFCVNILDKHIQSDSLVTQLYTLLQSKNIKQFDFTQKKFFREQTKFKRGSELKNITNCFSNTRITKHILDVFGLNINLDNIFLIKLPTLTSVCITDYLKILSSVFAKTVILKSVDDNMFCDSFYVLCLEPDVEKYSLFSSKLKTPKEGMYLRSLLSKTTTEYPIFQDTIKEFAKTLHYISFNFITELIKLLEKGAEERLRTNEGWQVFDDYIKNEWDTQRALQK
ncbi:putative mRNA capping enzyme small subunit [Diachasmimorpha longicaudata entomopoxvirus]|uniref:Putative mRNA capping enzyme small subunit n=1 Tax=Diachasmimorpha longicaudata entomopoxvirus TaxID=109981 RepID=A0A7R5WF34_9POXV|nr:putative mRNA capping enzyme small subunit [Diachasmimorpha longicaudata entomopoxvirus]AKS26325.1 putative mRNA capping enzyme small subunit [Diachasmimorpha longicaudata entomopoxvirus]